MSKGKYLQEGIYHKPGQRPSPNLTLLFLRVVKDADADDVSKCLLKIWDILMALKDGKVPSLNYQDVPNSALTVLIGYGYNIFNIDGVKKTRPAALNNSSRYLSPNPSGGGVFLPGAGFTYAKEISHNSATEDICLQFIAESQLAVNRPIVEIQTFLDSQEFSPLQIASVQRGFNREDGRSWIGFHDGVSNLPSRERWKAMEIKTNGWTKFGTYLSYIKLEVDLNIWNSISLDSQEAVVGRKKFTGCPIMGVDSNGNFIITSGCLKEKTDDIFDIKNQPFWEPNAPQANDEKIIKSHVQRANNAHSKDLSSKSSLRIYRQGYEYLETSLNSAKIHLGLNFISYQDTPERLIRILTQQSWLGKTNFGGPENQPFGELSNLLSVIAGGNYLVPPKNKDNVLPGIEIFK